jgi:hypothetical protein
MLQLHPLPHCLWTIFGLGDLGESDAEPYLLYVPVRSWWILNDSKALVQVAEGVAFD